MDFVKIPEVVKESLPRVIKEKDLVVIYERHDLMNHVYIESGKIYDNKYGAFHHDEFIGKPFGSKIFSNCSPGWVYALEPSPDLWTMALHSRTQIVDSLDSSIITFNLDIFPGCVVIESGTGSGCMTLSLARAVAPTGHVYSFEYNAARAEIAKLEFEKFGLSNLVTVQCQDVCGIIGTGGFTGVSDRTVDAVFLDLPSPWLAIPHALRALKPGRTICCYSPCIEQVMRTCEMLRELGFHSIRMVEARQRHFDGRVVDLEVPNLGVGVVPEASVHSSVGDKTTAAAATAAVVDGGTTEGGEGDNHALSEQHTKKRRIGGGETALAIGKDIDDEDDDDEEGVAEESFERCVEGLGSTLEENGKEADLATVSKDEGGNSCNVSESRNTKETSTQSGHQVLPLRGRKIRQVVSEPPLGSTRVFVARPNSSMKGHTAFLTFAVSPSIMSTISNSNSDAVSNFNEDGVIDDGSVMK